MARRVQLHPIRLVHPPRATRGHWHPDEAHPAGAQQASDPLQCRPLVGKVLETVVQHNHVEWIVLVFIHGLLHQADLPVRHDARRQEWVEPDQSPVPAARELME